MEYKNNTLLEAYDIDDVRLVREGEALRIEHFNSACGYIAWDERRQRWYDPARRSMLRTVGWAASVSIGIALGAWLVYQVVR